MAVAELVRSLGEHRIACPFCSDERRKKTNRDMSVTVFDDRVVYCCHHCGVSGVERLEERPVYREKRMAVAQNVSLDPVSESGIAWLKSRSISKDTARRAGCTMTSSYFKKLGTTSPAIAFNYFNKEKVYAQKIRSIQEKDFTCNGAPQTFYNSDKITDWSEIIIVEGELDVLSFMEAGYNNVVSIPSGAFKEVPNGDGLKLRFLTHHAEQLKDSKKIIICCDGDQPGETTGGELARRLGRDRCWTVTYPEGCKDANDVLMRVGKDGIRALIEGASPWPIEGLYDADHYLDDVERAWATGLQRGHTTGLTALDEYYSVVPGQLTVVTGHPSNGKSELVDQMMVHLAETQGWRFAICSFENEPSLHIAKLAWKYVGAPFFDTGSGRMSEGQKKIGLDFVRENFSFLHSKDGDLTTMDSIIERLKVAVLRHGVRGCVIDPYNYIAKATDCSETEWISHMLSRVRQFAQAYGVHVWFVAHPTKMLRTTDGKMGVPKGNDISGSAAWWAKADMGLTVHRPSPESNNNTEVHVWKCRFNWCGKQGVSKFYFNEYANRVLDLGAFSSPRKSP